MAVIALIGAGSREFTHQLVSDLVQNPVLSPLEFRLMDPDDDHLVASRRLVEDLVAKTGRLDVAIRYATDLEVSLQGADYVINTVLVGGRNQVQRDFEILSRYDLRATVGDTLGISAIARALRTIPQIIGLARMMENVCPSAVLLNYTNPMSMLMMALDRSTFIEHYGLCHSAYHTAVTLAQYLDVSFDEMQWTAAGINHMAWLLTISHKGQDLYPQLLDRARDLRVWRQDPVRFEILQQFGRFVTESSKHNAEYTAYFITHDEEIRRLAIPIGEYLARSMNNDARPLGGYQLLPPSNEYAPQFVRYRETGDSWGFQGNVLNRGLIDNLPGTACVEVLCRMSRGRVTPEPIGTLPPVLASLNQQAVAVQELTTLAALTEDAEAVFHAVALDPQASARLTLHDMRSLTRDLLAANRNWLTWTSET